MLSTNLFVCMREVQVLLTSEFGIIANARRIIKTTDGGITWITQSTAFGNVSRFMDERIYFFDDNNGFAFGDPIGGYNEIYTTTNGGDNWISSTYYKYSSKFT